MRASRSRCEAPVLLIPCPHCGLRPELEFQYGGEAGITRPVDADAISDADWAAFLVARSNLKGHHTERWRHVHGCGRFFNVARDTVTDRFERA